MAATFSATGSMGAARQGHTAALLKDGRVLVAGGSDSSTTLSSAETFDPITGVFSATGSMLTARSVHTATTLSSGQVLEIGGRGVNDRGTSLASAELYDPVTGSFAMTGGMGFPRALHTANVRADGSVLVIGGGEFLYRNPVCAPLPTCWPADVFVPTASAEVYEPATGRFAPCGTLALARELHTATLLASGAVLVAGGEVLQQGLIGGSIRCCTYVDTLAATATIQTLP